MSTKPIHSPPPSTIGKLVSRGSKCATVAFIISDFIAILFVALGGLGFFGPVGSVGFIVSQIGANVIFFVATTGLICTTIINCICLKKAASRAKANNPTYPKTKKQESVEEEKSERISDSFSDKDKA